jgi:hypothetical protein
MGDIGLSWFETALPRLLTMRDRLHQAGTGSIAARPGLLPAPLYG